MAAPKNKPYHYVYYSYEEWGRGYIGVRSCKCPPIEDSKYFGTFKDKNFKPTNKIILSKFDSREAAQSAEIQLHAFFEVDVNPHFANRCKALVTGFLCGFKPSTETIEKRRQKMLGRVLSEETKRKIGEANKIALKGKKLSDEVKAKIGARSRGIPRTKEHKQKMSEAQRGRKFTEQHLQNLRNAIKNRCFTTEQKKKLREIHEKPITLKNRSTGEILKFVSRAEAGRVLGISPSTIGTAIRRKQRTVHNYEICAIF
jgi:hypothetical protein